MGELFLTIVNMSISASCLVLVVLLLRLLTKRFPKWVCVLLWGFVALRLIIPVSVESQFSLMPDAVSSGRIVSWVGNLYIGEVETVEMYDNNVPETDPPLVTFVVEKGSLQPAKTVGDVVFPVLSWIWLAGVALMLIYTGVSYLLLRRKVATAVLLRDNIYQSENVDSPFVLGVIRPRIYLPYEIGQQNLRYVVAHEQSHIRRKDHWWKPFGFMLLAVHWFNPLLWLGYILLCRDIELACDEKVIKEMDSETRADYSQALVACSVNRRSIAACPLAFGEVGVKARIKSVLHYKKPAFWIIIAAVVICIAVAACFLTNPATRVDEKLSVFIDCQIAGYHQTAETSGRASCVNWEVLGKKKHGAETTVYMWVLYEEYSMENGEIHLETDVHIPAAVTAKYEDGAYQLVEYWEPGDGDRYEADIREKFPWHLESKALNPERYLQTQRTENEKMAWDYFRTEPYGAIAWKYIVASKNSSVPLIEITNLEEAIGQVFWLTLSPDEIASDPFTLRERDSGTDVIGNYTVLDTENLVPLEYFLPSGLSPQYYLLRKADVTRQYIVLVSFSEEADAQTYAFGIKFGQSAGESVVPGSVSAVVKNPWVQEYVPGAEGMQGDVSKRKYTSISPDFAIGADKNGMAVFKEPEKAFQTFTELYADSLAATQQQFSLKPISQSNYRYYKTYGWQTKTHSDEEKEQAYFVTQFLDIYENSFLDESEMPKENVKYMVTTGIGIYYAMNDGTWRMGGNTYQYRLEITGRMPDAAKETTFVYLSNFETITFEQAWKAAGCSSNTDDYFQPEEAVLVHWETK